jgi:hypothetical protein
MSNMVKDPLSESLKEGNSEQGSNFKLETKGLTKDQTETETTTYFPTPTIHQRRPFTNYQEIIKLGDEPITFESITNKQIILQILLAENMERLRERSSWKYEKWERKVGNRYSQEVRSIYATYTWIRELIDVLAKYVNGAFGLTGTRAILPHRVMLNLYRRLKDEAIGQWVARTHEVLKLWESKPDADPRIARASAHLLLKLLYHLSQG